MKDAEAERKKQRDQVWSEIISSEKAYVHGLEILEKYFVSPIAVFNKLESTRFMSDADYDYCFKYIFEIHALNKKLFSRFEDVRLNKPENEKWSTIPKVLKNMCPLLKSYTNFVSSYDDIAAKLKRLCKENEKLNMFIQNTEKKVKKDGGVSFFSYMSFVHLQQRIPRYSLLLRELTKNTPQTDTDYQDIVEANKEIDNVAAHINEIRRHAEEFRKVTTIQESVDGLDDVGLKLDVGGRKILLQTEATQVESSLKSRAVVIYLFTDVLLVCTFIKQKQARPKYHFHLKLSQIPIIWANPLESDSLRLHIVTKDGNIELKMDSKDEREKFVKTLNEAVERLIQQKPKMQNQSKAEVTKRHVRVASVLQTSPANQRKSLFGGKKEEAATIAAVVAEQQPLEELYDPVVITVKALETTKISFKENTLLFVKKKFNDFSLCSIAMAKADSSAPSRVEKVPNDYFRELTDLEKVECEFVPKTERDKIREQLPAEALIPVSSSREDISEEFITKVVEDSLSPISTNTSSDDLSKPVGLSIEEVAVEQTQPEQTVGSTNEDAPSETTYLQITQNESVTVDTEENTNPEPEKTTTEEVSQVNDDKLIEEGLVRVIVEPETPTQTEHHEDSFFRPSPIVSESPPIAQSSPRKSVEHSPRKSIEHSPRLSVEQSPRKTAELSPRKSTEQSPRNSEPSPRMSIESARKSVEVSPRAKEVLQQITEPVKDPLMESSIGGLLSTGFNIKSYVGKERSMSVQPKSKEQKSEEPKMDKKLSNRKSVAVAASPPVVNTATKPALPKTNSAPWLNDPKLSNKSLYKKLVKQAEEEEVKSSTK